MGLTMPVYAYNPDGRYAPESIPNAYVWFCSGAQQLDTLPYSMCLSGRIYRSVDDFRAGYAPLDYLNRTYTAQSDIGGIVYGHYDPNWVPPVAMDPITKQVGPLMGLKKETAYLCRNDVDLGQAGAVWD